MELKWKKLDERAKAPTKGHPGDAGIDFFALETVIFQPGKQMRVQTGIAVEIPENHVGLIWDKSSVSFNQGLKIMGGVIDSGFRGEIVMSLFNTTNEEQKIEAGHKIAQMIIQRFEDCDLLEVTELSDTIRGVGREGSTGKN
ncbi:MAG: dUTP diphosphatase [Bacteroidetes bacterium]|nr:dUTP diphosphatase [Bacteroidota bacterium]